MIPVIKNEDWFKLLEKSPKFIIKACNRKSTHDVFIIAVQDEYAVIYDTQNSTVSTHQIESTNDGKKYLLLRTCGHTERIWLSIAADDPNPVEEMILETPKKKAGRPKKVIEDTDISDDAKG